MNYELNIEYDQHINSYGYYVFDKDLNVVDIQFGYKTYKDAWRAGKQLVETIEGTSYDEEYVGQH